MKNIQIVQESVVFQKTDAIVNAANGSMLGGGGVDGAIHDAAGEELYDFFAKQHRRWLAGDVELSPGFNLPAKHILHAVGPVWYGGNRGEPEALKKCYLGCLDKAAAAGCKSIAFCCISVGIYGYPLDDATRIALETTKSWLASNNSDMQVKFCCFTAREFEAYERISRESL